MADNSDERFKAAADWLSTNPDAASLSNEAKLEIYGLFKFVNTGAGPHDGRPSIFSITARAKHDAWAKAAQGNVKDAEERYVDIAQSLGWKGEKGKGMGVRVSTIKLEEGQAGEAHGVHAAVLMNDLKAVRGLNVNAVDEDGNTPLHLAADRGLLDMARVLLDCGADRGAKDEDGQTPLDIAKLLDREDLVKILES